MSRVPTHGTTSQRLAASWRRAWRTSIVRSSLAWYRDEWLKQPVRHTGLVLCGMAAAYWLGSVGQPEPWSGRWVIVTLGVAGVVMLFNRSDWDAIRRESLVFRWLHQR